MSHNASRGTTEVGSIASGVDSIWSTLHLYDLKAFEVFNFGHGFETTGLLLNYMLTYTPIFFVIILVGSLFFSLGKSFRLPKVKLPSKAPKSVKVVEPKRVPLEAIKVSKKALEMPKMAMPSIKFSMPKLPRLPRFKFEKKEYQTHWIGRYWILRLVLDKDLYRAIPFD